MAITIRFIDSPPVHPLRGDSRHYNGTINFDKLEVGDMCYFHYEGEPCKDRAILDCLHLTAHYFAVNVDRPPLVLALPNHSGGKLYFLVDGQCYSNDCTKCGKKAYKNSCEATGGCTPKGYYDGWTVSGAPPGITVSPSVDYDEKDPPIKHYHGFIQNGVIGDG